MNCILVFLIFSGAIVAGNALSCICCKETGEGKQNCSGVIQQCANDNDTCATQIEYNNVDPDKKTTVKKSCLPAKDKNICQQPMFLNADRFNMSLFTDCCDTDGCNTNNITMPPKNTTLNGRQCDTCFVEGKLQCDDFKTVNCTGNQLQCFEYSGNATRPEHNSEMFGFKGCVTYGTCFVDLNNLPGTEVGSNAVYSCT
uniref:Sodefrin-like factor A n=1 Tax=Nyctibatrachus petraeus TaxID=1104422 RepID=A0A513ZV83_9NEOB|nr:sodefrin precursor-like factor A [Nyctibatrachus petraeus]